MEFTFGQDDGFVDAHAKELSALEKLLQSTVAPHTIDLVRTLASLPEPVGTPPQIFQRAMELQSMFIQEGEYPDGERISERSVQGRPYLRFHEGYWFYLYSVDGYECCPDKILGMVASEESHGQTSRE